MTTFDEALSFTCGPSIEGGVSDVSGDDGGLTDHGVTQATYDRYRVRKHLTMRPVTEITSCEVRDVYHLFYWLPAHCPDIRPRLAIVHFDWAVNHGVRGAMKTLQRAVGVDPDGFWGPQTMAAVAKGDVLSIVDRYLDLRVQRYLDIVAARPEEKEFLNGWEARVSRLRAYVANIGG